jgi:hypothetical protein
LARPAAISSTGQLLGEPELARADRRFPTDGAYHTAAVIGIAVMALSALTSLALERRLIPRP